MRVIRSCVAASQDTGRDRGCHATIPFTLRSGRLQRYGCRHGRRFSTGGRPAWQSFRDLLPAGPNAGLFIAGERTPPDPWDFQHDTVTNGSAAAVVRNAGKDCPGSTDSTAPVTPATCRPARLPADCKDQRQTRCRGSKRSTGKCVMNDITV